ncbi:MAG: caspase family protein [Terriglobia bacterium]
MAEKKSALIIANFQYEDHVLRQLIAPAQDAEALAEVLGNPGIGGFEVQTLLNQPSYKVSETIEAFFADRKRDDLLLLYFSGHGVKDEDGQLYFATSNTQHKLLRSTAVWANFVNDVMFRSRSRRQVLLLDCCYSGAFARGMVAKGTKDVGTRDHFEGRGRVVLTASDAMQYSFEGGEVQGEGVRSIFTQTLVKGLETGEADLDADGLVSLDDLYDYIHDRVTDEMPQQSPGKWAFDVQGEIVIARNPHPPVVKAGNLPLELREAIENPLVGVRVGAVQELERLLRGKNKALAVAAKEALLSLKQDDSRQVSTAAEKVLAASATQEMPLPIDTQSARLQAEGEAIRHDKQPLPTLEAAEQQRTLEAALPKRVPVGRSTQLLALIRRTDSEGLRAVLAKENIQSLTAGDVNSKPFQLEFSKDQNGVIQSAEIVLRIEAPDFEPKSQTRKLLVPPRGDSETCTFLLTPKSPGELLVNLEIFKSDLLVASRVITTTAEFFAQEVVSVATTLVSIPLIVIVYQAQAASGQGGSREVLAGSNFTGAAIPPAAATQLTSDQGPKTTRLTSLPRIEERDPLDLSLQVKSPYKPGGSGSQPFGTPAEPMAPPREAPKFTPLTRAAPPRSNLKIWASVATAVIVLGVGVGYLNLRPSAIREGPEKSAGPPPIVTPPATDLKGHTGNEVQSGPSKAGVETKMSAEVSSATSQGDAYYERGLYGKAISEYQRGLSLDPQNPGLRDKFERARRAQARVEGEIASAGVRGDTFYEQGAYEKAIGEYQKGLSLDPSNDALQKKIARARHAQAAEQRYGRQSPASSRTKN